MSSGQNLHPARSAALRSGAVNSLDSPGEVISITRDDDGDATLCVVNFGVRTFDWPAPTGGEF